MIQMFKSKMYVYTYIINYYILNMYYLYSLKNRKNI
jgi:hypothetical protein